jgi:hypothetical protein
VTKSSITSTHELIHVLHDEEVIKMAKHEKEKNLLGELLLETKRRGGGL